MDTKTQRRASACLEAITELAAAKVGDLYGVHAEDSLVPLRVLLDHAEGLINGGTEARDKKNAGDRKRRAKSKAPGKKPRKKNPRGAGRTTTPPRAAAS